MDIWIYGAGKRCDHLMEKLSLYPDINVVGVADSFFRGERYGFTVSDLLHNDDENCPKDSVVVITIAKPKDVLRVARALQLKGYSNIYFYLEKTMCFQGFLNGECRPILSILESVFPSLEMHVVDYCNLNCAGCLHFSPLFPKKAPPFDRRIQDLKTMKNLFHDILLLYLLGGEPLLNKDVCRYMMEARRLYPDAEIQLITNGLLLPKMEEDFFVCAHDYQITIVISVYPPTSKILDIITGRLQQNHIDYILRDSNERRSFNRPLSMRKNSVWERCCLSDGCTAVCDGKIARCPTLLYINKFNEFFKENLPSAGIYSLTEFDNGETLKKQLEERIPLCDYCVRNDMPWHTCGSTIRLEEFASPE